MGVKNVGTDAGLTSNIQVRISPNYGKKVKRILHTVWNPQEKLNTAYDCQNLAGVSKVASYQTYWDNTPIQDRPLKCSGPSALSVDMDDWLENKQFLEDSVITSKESYQLNWFHQDQMFSQIKREDRYNILEQNLDLGLSLDHEHTWYFQCTNGTTPNAVHYTWVEFSQDIDIIPGIGPVVRRRA